MMMMLMKGRRRRCGVSAPSLPLALRQLEMQICATEADIGSINEEGLHSFTNPWSLLLLLL